MSRHFEEKETDVIVTVADAGRTEWFQTFKITME